MHIMCMGDFFDNLTKGVMKSFQIVLRTKKVYLYLKHNQFKQNSLARKNFYHRFWLPKYSANS